MLLSINLALRSYCSVVVNQHISFGLSHLWFSTIDNMGSEVSRFDPVGEAFRFPSG